MKKIIEAKDFVETIHKIFVDCLFFQGPLSESEKKAIGEQLEKGQIPEGSLLLHGLRMRVSFCKKKLQEHKETIKAILNEMPDEFHAGKGGGWSFLNLAATRDGILWGQHTDIEALVVLAIAMGMGGFQMPRELWPSLPGGMPYIVFDTSK